MKRRQYIGITRLAVLGAYGGHSQSLKVKTPRWQPDGAGLLAKIGILTPQGDAPPESEA